MIISRRTRWAGHVARTGWKRNVCRVLVEEIRPLSRSRSKWEGVIKMDLKKKWTGRTWTGFILLGAGTSGGLL
jgi:hypothetical protein